jgi:hypothetical protein
MLEVGNGGMTNNEYRAHFALVSAIGAVVASATLSFHLMAGFWSHVSRSLRVCSGRCSRRRCSLAGERAAPGWSQNIACVLPYPTCWKTIGTLTVLLLRFLCCSQRHPQHERRDTRDPDGH